MRTPELKSALTEALTILCSYSDELRDLDQVIGDGDLGITITSGSNAVIEALTELQDDATPTDLARAAAKAFANANPSTMAALVAGALLAGSKVWAGKDDIDVADAAAFAKAGGEAIAKRGKTKLGDKTVLDAILPAADALNATAQSGGDAGQAITAAISAARKGVEDTKEMQSQRGRAAWLQERSIGLQDPGATAFLRFLESWQTANNDRSAA